MLKALLKKQFLEIGQVFFFDRKKGRTRGAKGIVGVLALFLVIYGFSAFAFFGIGDALAHGLLPDGLDWMYFALMGAMALFVGTFGSVVASYTMLFRAKDNLFLLSLPIPPAAILLARMVSVFVSALLFVVAVWVPAVVQYLLVKGALGLAVANSCLSLSIALLLVISLLSVALCCVAGWVIALIANHVKSKALVTAAITALCLGLYYYVYFQIRAIYEQIMLMKDQIADGFSAYAWPLYQLGLAAAGDAVAFGLLTAMTLIVLGAVYAVMSVAFLRLATTQVQGGPKEKFDADKMKMRPAKQALLWREFKRFVTCTPYVTNCCIGLVVLVVGAVAAVLNASSVNELLQLLAQELPMYVGAVPVLVALSVCMIICMSPISTPSVSLEGKMLWIVKCMPVDTWLILEAKENLHALLCGVPAVFSALVVARVFQVDAVSMVLCPVVAWAFSWLTAAWGLFMDVRNPHLTWTNEVVPVKQNFSVVIVMFGGWALCTLLIVLYMLLSCVLDPRLYLILVAVAFGAVTLLLQRWLKTKGVEAFEAL